MSFKKYMTVSLRDRKILLHRNERHAEKQEIEGQLDAEAAEKETQEAARTRNKG